MWWKELDDLVEQGRRDGVLARPDKLPPPLDELKKQEKGKEWTSQQLRERALKAFSVAFHPDWVRRKYTGEDKELGVRLAASVLQDISVQLEEAVWLRQLFDLDSVRRIMESLLKKKDSPPSPSNEEKVAKRREESIKERKRKREEEDKEYDDLRRQYDERRRRRQA